MYNEEIETDSELQSDTIKKAAQACDDADQLQKITDRLDQQVEDILWGSNRNSRTFTEQDVADMLDMRLQDVEAINKQKQAARQQTDLQSYLPLHKRNGLNAGEQRTFNFLHKNFVQHGGDLTATMIAAVDLFRENFSAHELTLLEKCIRALDLSLFLQLLSRGMQKV